MKKRILLAFIITMLRSLSGGCDSSHPLRFAPVAATRSCPNFIRVGIVQITSNAFALSCYFGKK